MHLELHVDMTEHAAYDPGRDLRQRARFTEAAPADRAALKEAPQTADLRGRLGTVLAMLDRFNEARDECDIAIRLDEDAASAFVGLGVIHLRQGLYADAEREFRKALDRDSASVDARGGLAVAMA